MTEYAEKNGDYQNGFRTNRGTTDNICILRQIKEKAYEYNIQTDTLFIGFKQAFYSIYRHRMIKKITTTRNIQKTLKTKVMTLKDPHARVVKENMTKCQC